MRAPAARVRQDSSADTRRETTCRMTAETGIRRSRDLPSIALVAAIVLITALTTIPSLQLKRGETKTRTRGEIRQLEHALDAFEAHFGVLPPSRIILHECPSRHPYDLEGTSVKARIEQRTVKYLQQIWPDFPVLTCVIDANADGTIDRDWVDFNGNDEIDDELDLDGAECLVFFLGGRVHGKRPIGFSQNAHYPFSTEFQRIGPFVPFDRNRLIDRDQDGFPEYVDTGPHRRAPFLYFSAYQREGYNFHIDQETADNGAFQPYYTDGDPRVDRAQVRWYLPNGYQIIAAGADGEYGTGGLYDQGDLKRLSPQDGDNFTNFHFKELREVH